jgi:hypothetical protein
VNQSHQLKEDHFEVESRVPVKISSSKHHLAVKFIFVTNPPSKVYERLTDYFETGAFPFLCFQHHPKADRLQSRIRNGVQICHKMRGQGIFTISTSRADENTNNVISHNSKETA